MNNLTTDHLRRLEQLLATARADFDTLAYIILEGATQVTFYSHQRSITVPIGGDDVGHFNGLLEDAALARITALEQEIVQTHAQIAQQASEQRQEATELAGYRQQARASAGSPNRRKQRS